MSRDSWFRHHTWTEADQSEFFTRLDKSRGASNKAQYARIQALELHQSGGAQYAGAALKLLDLILDSWKSEAQIAAVQHQRADCLRDLGDSAGALAAYREVFAAQRVRPSWLTNAHLDFAWWIATTKLQDHYDEALGILTEFTHGQFFQAVIYKTEGARALILEARGNQQAAAVHARSALAAASVERTEFRYHPTVGLVRVQDQAAHDALSRLGKG